MPIQSIKFIKWDYFCYYFSEASGYALITYYLVYCFHIFIFSINLYFILFYYPIFHYYNSRNKCSHIFFYCARFTFFSNPLCLHTNGVFGLYIWDPSTLRKTSGNEKSTFLKYYYLKMVINFVLSITLAFFTNNFC